MNRQEIKHRKAIKRRHDAIVESARVKRNVRLLGLKDKRDQAEVNRKQPRLQKGFHIRNRNLVQLATGDTERMSFRTRTMCINIKGPMLIQMIQSRHGLEGKVKKLLGVEELVSE